MQLSLAEAIERLADDAGASCRYPISTADFADDAEWDAQDAGFGDAVRKLTAAHGPPASMPCAFPGLDLDRAACWVVGEKVLYVILALEDNTRIRRLVLGVSPRGEVRFAAG